MKLVSVCVEGNNRIGYLEPSENAVSQGGRVDCVVLDPVEGWPVDVKELIASPELITKLNEWVNSGIIARPTKQARLRAPVSGVEKLICVGINYADHAKEMGSEPPHMPVIFNKFPSTIIAPNSEIRLPAISTQVDFEAEMVVVIGKKGKCIAREDAMGHVFGYCVGIDVSARDWQKKTPSGQWLLGKSFDTFAPLGPAIVTKDEIPDPQCLDIQLRLNGQVMQDSNTEQLIFPVDHLIYHISQFTTLVPGDLIFTGTPPGVGAGRNPPVFLKPGDEIEVEIEGLGILTNPVVADC